MQTFLPGFVYKLETIPAESNGTPVPGHSIFHRLFWTFHPCISAFTHCKPIVQVDGTWLYGKYRGTLFVAVAQDGNNNIFPIAFALVEGETKNAWSFFLKNLRRHITPQTNICLISDRHESIKSAYNNPRNGWNKPPSKHVFCVRNIAQNFMREIKDRELRKKVVNMGYAINEPTFKYYRNEIRVANVQALQWVDNIPKEKWTQAYDGGSRWGHMTTNLVESINSVLKGARNLPIIALVKSTYFRLATLFSARKDKWMAVSASSAVYTENCMKNIQDAISKSTSHRVHSLDRQTCVFYVQETVNQKEGQPMGDFKVDLQHNWCDCGKFQVLHLPCSHVIAACSSINQDYTPLIAEVFKVTTVLNIYIETFPVIPNKDYWPQYDGDIVCHDASM